jgi:hypothetical protein
MKTYRGIRTADRNVVCAISPDGPELLSLRLDLASLSPEGFDWGQSSEGAAQLALALLADGLGDAAAMAYYRDFEEQVVQELPDSSWERSLRAIQEWFHGAVRAAGITYPAGGLCVEADWELDPRQLGPQRDWDFGHLAV